MKLVLEDALGRRLADTPVQSSNPTVLQFDSSRTTSQGEIGFTLMQKGSVDIMIGHPVPIEPDKEHEEDYVHVPPGASRLSLGNRGILSITLLPQALDDGRTITLSDGEEEIRLSHGELFSPAPVPFGGSKPRNGNWFISTGESMRAIVIFV